LKIEQQPLEDQQVKLIVEVEPDQLEAAKHKAARAIARKAKIPGFRPGKAPYAIIERHAGAAAVLEEAIDILIQELYPKIIDESGIKPYGPGKLEKVVSTDPPTFEFIIPLDAEVELPDFRAVRRDYKLAPLDEKEITKVIENLRQQQAVLEPVERPAQEGDEVTVKLSGQRKQVDEGESAILVRERSLPVVILAENPEKEENSGVEWPFPGFSRNLIGLSAGAEKTFDYTFPADSDFEQLCGQASEFKIVIEGVKSRTVPEFSDELAQSIGEYENRAALEKDVRTRLEDRARNEYDNKYDERVLDEILKDVKVKYPPQMLESELETVLHQLEDRLGAQKMDMSTYLKSRSMDMDALKKELTPAAETRLKKMLTLFEIAKKENIQVSPEAVQKETIDTLNMYFRNQDPKKGKKGPSEALVNNLMNSITADLLIKNTTEQVRSIAKGENPAIKEAVAQEQAAVETGTSAAAPQDTADSVAAPVIAVAAAPEQAAVETGTSATAPQDTAEAPAPTVEAQPVSVEELPTQPAPASEEK
jgi:trigger factor